jgi:DNA-binding CsgD family transcriptional regulator
VLGRLPSGDAHASFGHVGLVGPRWRTWKGGPVEHRVRLDGGQFAGRPGGPVVDAAGRVIGIASAALSRHHGTLLPAVTVARVAAALRDGGRVPRAHLGVALQSAAVRLDGDTRTGLLVTHVADDGAAARAGVLVGLQVRDPARPPAPPVHDSGDAEPLTEREVQVLELIAKGLTNRDIGRLLGISAHTVKFHVGQVLGKLGAASRAEAVSSALRLGLIGV